MRNARLCLMLAAVACLALPATGLAAPDSLVYSGMPAVQAPVTDVAPAPSAGALQAAAPAQAPVVYLVPQSQGEAQPSGIGGFIASFGGWGAIVAMLLLAVFGIWTGARSAAAKAAVLKAAEASWFAAEAIGGSGAEKYQAAVENFLERMGQQKVKVTLESFVQATKVFEDKSNVDKVARAKVSETRPQTPLAGA